MRKNITPRSKGCPRETPPQLRTFLRITVRNSRTQLGNLRDSEMRRQLTIKKYSLKWMMETLDLADLIIPRASLG